LSDRFAEAAQACQDLPRLGILLADAALELGFHHFALLDHASLAGGRGFVRLDNYPQGWVSELVERGYAAHDPVHLASRRSNMGFRWVDIGSLVSLEGAHLRVLKRSRDHGLGDGFTVPSNVPGEPGASCSFAVRAGSELPAARLDSAELIGAHALRAARRLRSFTLAPRPRLSRREIECLRLVARGKTDWEIATILGLSEHTVRQYVKRARAAYDAVSRAQLVAFAFRDAWLSFEDAIPPHEGMA
jgi:LuxR family quorum-sensing system transcriptional regulator CciR